MTNALKIKDTRNAPKCLRVRDINKGEIFESDGFIYMKVEDPLGVSSVNVVMLSTRPGTLNSIDPENSATPLDANLEIS